MVGNASDGHYKQLDNNDNLDFHLGKARIVLLHSHPVLLDLQKRTAAEHTEWLESLLERLVGDVGRCSWFPEEL